MVVANRCPLMEKVLLDRAIKNMSQWEEGQIHIFYSHLCKIRYNVRMVVNNNKSVRQLLKLDILQIRKLAI